MQGGPDNDHFSNGALGRANVVVDLSDVTYPMSIRLDSKPGESGYYGWAYPIPHTDGPGEYLGRIHVVVGGQANDLIIGGDEDDSLDGGGGEDEISGAGGDDMLFGGIGADALLGRAGENDSADGGNDEDVDSCDAETVTRCP